VVYVEALLYLTHIVGHFLLDVFIEVTSNLIPICQRGYYVDSCEVCQSLITVGIALEHCVFLCYILNTDPTGNVINSDKFCDAHIPNTNDFTIYAKVVNNRFSTTREENMLPEEAQAKIYVTLKASQKSHWLDFYGKHGCLHHQHELQ